MKKVVLFFLVSFAVSAQNKDAALKKLELLCNKTVGMKWRDGKYLDLKIVKHVLKNNEVHFEYRNVSGNILYDYNYQNVSWEDVDSYELKICETNGKLCEVKFKFDRYLKLESITTFNEIRGKTIQEGDITAPSELVIYIPTKKQGEAVKCIDIIIAD